MIPDAYKLVVAELEVQTQRMNALNAAMDEIHDIIWHDKLFLEFGQASFLVVALSDAKKKMEDAGESR